MFIRLLTCAAALCALPGAARAEWFEAASPNFVVYADSSRTNIERFSQELERFHAAMEFLTGVEPTQVSPSNRVTVYVVESVRRVRNLAGGDNANLGGFYIPRAGASAAFVPPVTGGSADLSWSKITLLHEYAHHFMISTSAFPMPRWYSEGGAEFFASAAFPTKGGITIGRPAYHRADEIVYARDVRARLLLDTAGYQAPKNGAFDAFYGKSWALFHYLTFNKERSGQLLRYLQLMAQGKASLDAGKEAFGDLDRLEADLTRYLEKSRFMEFRLPDEMLKVGKTQVRALSAAEAAVLPLAARSDRGVDKEEAAALVVEARALAARFPADAAVLAELAEAEYDSAHYTQALAAANAALKIDPGQVNAHVQKGYALLQMARESGNAADFQNARSAFVALNRLENDHPLSLAYYYRTYLDAGVTPPQVAVQGLERAVLLAPFDLGLRMSLVRQQLRDGQGAAARRNLVPIAYNPHGGGLADHARAMLARLDADPKWDGTGMAAPDDEKEE